MKSPSIWQWLTAISFTIIGISLCIGYYKVDAMYSDYLQCKAETWDKADEAVDKLKMSMNSTQPKHKKKS